MIKRLFLFLFLFATSGFPACSKVGALLNWTTATGISRANLNYNPILLKTAHDDCADSLNAVLSILSGYSSALTLVSNGDMRLTTDNDANGTGNVFSVTTNSTADTLLKLSDTFVHRLYGHLTIDSNLTVNKKVIITDSLRVPVISSALSVAQTLTAGQKLIVADSARIPAISSALSLAQTLGVTGRATFTDSIVGASQRLTGNLKLAKVTASDSVIGTVYSGTSGIFSDLSSGRIPYAATGGKLTQDNLYWSAASDFLGIGSGASTPLTEIYVNKSTASDVTAEIMNANNSGAAGNAILELAAGGTSGGDPYVLYSVSGSTAWSSGIDNSVAGDPYVIAASSALGTSNAVSISTAGAMTVTSTVTADSLISSKFYAEGTFTAAATGFSACSAGALSGSTCTATARWTRFGKGVILYIPDMFGTSSSTALTITGLPAAITPARDQNPVVDGIYNNGSNYQGFITVGAAGTIQPGFRSSFGLATQTYTASGIKGIGSNTVAYNMQ